MIKGKKQLLVFGLIVFGQLLFACVGLVSAQRPLNNDRSQQLSQQLVGSWQSSDSTMEIRSNGTLTLNGKPYSYKSNNSEIVISNNNKTISFPFELNGDYLTITLSSQRLMYKRMAGRSKTDDEEQIFGSNSRQNNTSSELFGRWQSDKGILEFSEDGMMTINNEKVPFKVNGSAISVSSPQGVLNFPFRISGNQLIMGASGRQVIYTRIGKSGNGNILNRNDESDSSFDTNQPKGNGGITGRWQSDEATLDIRPNGTITINGEQYSYKVSGSTIMVSSNEGSMSFPFQLSGDKMVVSVEGRRVIYTRITGNTDRSNKQNLGTTNGLGSVSQELVGKWCHLSNVNLNSKNSRISQRCITLNGDGTYEYYGETSYMVQSGPLASEDRDSGRWSASGNTITAFSDKKGKLVLNFEKRNHPKNGDPMIVIEGEAFATYYKRSPW